MIQPQLATCEHMGKPMRVHQRFGRYDPTATTGLRQRFVSDMGKRFRELRGLVRRAIVQQDCFGLIDRHSVSLVSMALPAHRAFAFPRSADKVDAFMDWLRGQSTLTILETPHFGRAIETPWTNTYIESGYQKGLARARSEMVSAGYPVPSLEETGGLHFAFNQPIHADRVGLLYTRAFNDLKGITDTMDGQISRVLAQAMADGKNPRDIAELLTKTITGPVGDLGITDTLGRFIPAERRAKMLARTEIIRAHHAATIQEYRNWAIEGVRVQAEWVTAGYNVCSECSDMAGRIFTLDEIEGMIPLHPNCRCCAIPIEAGTAAVSTEVEERRDVLLDTQSRVDAAGIASFPTKGKAKNLSMYRGIKDTEWEDWAYDPEAFHEALFTNKDKIFFSGQWLEGVEVDELRALGYRMQAAAQNSGITQTSVLRGESYVSETALLERYRVNSKLLTPKLTSTTFDEAVAMEYAKSDVAEKIPVIVRFTNPNGIRGVQTAPLGVPSNEVVLPFGEKYRVARTFKREDNVWIVDLYSTEKFPELWKVDALSFRDDDAALLRLLGRE